MATVAAVELALAEAEALLGHPLIEDHEIDNGLELVEQIAAYRQDCNNVRPHAAIAWNLPAHVYAGIADPTIPNFEIEETLPRT